MKLALLTILVLPGIGAPAWVTTPPIVPAGPGALSSFVVVYDPGPLWQPGVPPGEQPGVREHGRFLLQLHADGVMESAGPLDGGGGVVVLRARDLEAAGAIVSRDPAVVSGLMVVNMIRRWEQRDWSAMVRRADPAAGNPSREAVSQSGNGDFDFEFGEWKTELSRLENPLSGSTTWIDYSGTSTVRPVWGGRANLGELEVEGPAGRIQGLSLRLFNPESGQWNIHWANSRTGAVGAAMVGGFANGVGEFYNQELFNGRAVLVRFIFSEITPNSFRLEQAFSPDGGKSWEPNWIARFTR